MCDAWSQKVKKLMSAWVQTIQQSKYSALLESLIINKLLTIRVSIVGLQVFDMNEDTRGIQFGKRYEVSRTKDESTAVILQFQNRSPDAEYLKELTVSSSGEAKISSTTSASMTAFCGTSSNPKTEYVLALKSDGKFQISRVSTIVQGLRPYADSAQSCKNIQIDVERRILNEKFKRLTGSTGAKKKRLKTTITSSAPIMSTHFPKSAKKGSSIRKVSAFLRASKLGWNAFTVRIAQPFSALFGVFSYIF